MQRVIRRAALTALALLVFGAALLAPRGPFVAGLALGQGPGEICGDGQLEAGESCDDGDLQGGDGCSSSCLIEPFFACTGEPSHCGTLVEGDLAQGGDGLLTFDQLSGLEWLDLTETQGLSFDALESDPQGFLSQGWRPARAAEVCALHERFALAPVPCPDPAPRVAPGDLVGFAEGLLGATGGSPATPILRGTFDDAGLDTDPGLRGRADLSLVDTGVPETHAQASADVADPAASAPDVAHYLVRVGGPCGDLDVSDGVDALDVDLLRDHLTDPNAFPLAAPGLMRCTVEGLQRPCDVLDAVVIRRSIDAPVLLGQIEHFCEAAVGTVLCGDGAVEGAEQCDDANALAGDGCALCSVEPGFVCGGEPSQCVLAQACGDSSLDPGEGCDDGDRIPGDGCSDVCQVESGFSCAGEPSVCVSMVCGNGLIEGTETCDDSNANAGDGCSATCQAEGGWTCAGQPSVCQRCGDGALQGNEACDDSNAAAGDGCSATCQAEGGWTCAGQPSICQRCGDGALQGTETCDDSNATAGDGCSATCQVEGGFSCTGQPSICVSMVCGNGSIEGTETCDDSNTTAADGCSAT